jgi:hypothetical protein
MHMSEMTAMSPDGQPDPVGIMHRLPAGERELFLAEYRAALDAAHEVWRYRQLQDVLARWNLVAVATSQPGYAEALSEARHATTPGVTLDQVTARRAAR